MKSNQTNPNRPAVRKAFAAAVILAAILSLGDGAFAQNSYTWTGNGSDNNWGTQGNWNVNSGSWGTMPQAYLNFAGSGNGKLSPYNNISAYSAGFQIYFNSGASPYTLTGNAIKFYNYSGNNPKIENDSTSLQTINFGFGSESSGNNMDITAQSGNLAFGSSFSYFDDAGVYFAVHANNSHTVTFNGAIGNGSQTANFLLDGGGVCVFNAANSYTGQSQINAGELQITANGSINSGSAIYLGYGTTAVTSQLTLTAATGGETFANGFTVNTTSGGPDNTKRIIAGSNTSGTNIYSGTITLNSDVQVNAAAGGRLNFSGELGVNNYKAYANGAGTVLLGGNNVDNVNLGLVVNSGTVVLGKTGTGHAVGAGATVNGGTLQLGTGGNGDQIYDSASAGLVVNSGGTFDMNGMSETIYYASLNGTGVLGAALTNSSSTAATLTLSNASLLTGNTTVGGPGNITIAGAGNLYASPPSTLTKTGSGTLTLSCGAGVDNTALALTVNAGTVILNKTGTTGPGASNIHAAGTVTINNGGTVQLQGSGNYQIYDGLNTTIASGGVLDMDGQNQTFVAGVLNISGTGSGGGGALINSSSTASTLTGAMTLGAFSSVGGNGSGGLTISGPIGDGGSGYGLTKVGSGALTLQGTNTFGGATTISAGTLTIGGAGQLGSGTYSAAITNNSAFNYNSSAAQTLSGIISGTGILTDSGAGTLTLSGANTFSGATTISAGTLAIGGAGQLGSSGNYSAAITNNSAFNYNSSAAQTLSGIISGTGSLTENGAGALTLSGANTFTGNMTVKAGAVSVSNPTGLGVGTVVVGSTSGSANASLLAVGGNNTFTNLITVQSGNSGVLTIGNQSGANNSYVFSGNVALNNALTLVAASTGTVKLSGNITGSSLITVTNDGALVSTSQYVDLTGANSGFTGNVAVNGGMLRLETGTALNSANTVQLNFTNTALNLNATADVTLAALTGVAGGIVTNTSGAGRTLTLAGAGQYAFNGAIMDGNTTGTRISLTFAGAGTNIFGGTNTYSGATLITNGTLLVNGFNLGTNSVTVTNAGSTLGGTGVISGPVRFNAGTLAQFTLGAPMTISNSVTLATGGVIPQVKIAMSNNVPLGTYVLATFTSSTGVFSNTPVILAGGSLAANTVGSIVTTSTNVVLNVVMAIIPSTNTITSSNSALVYGGSVTFTATVQTNSPTGAASGANSNFIFAVDGVSVATNLVNGSSQATCTISTLTAGSHAIQAIYVGDATYSPSTNTYVQTVSQLPVMITGTRAYDGTALATNTILKITNSVGSDNVTNFLQTTAGYATLAGSGVGSQNIIATNHLTLNGGVGTNYTLVGASGSVVITAIPLTITASSTNKVYGQNLVFAGTEFTVVGLTNGDTVSSVTLTSSGATSTATVGSYGIVPSSAAGSGLANYSIAYSNGTLTVTQATPTNTLAASANPSGFQDTIVFTNTLNADATGYVLFSTNSVLWSSNNLSGGVAVSLSITNLPRGTNLITAAYSGDTNYVAGSISLNQIVTNHPPVANINTYGRGTFTTWQIAVSNLLTNASDVDGDTLSLVGVATSTNGITLVIDTNAPARVSYYNTNLVADQFTYTVADGFGGTNSAVITLTASGGGVTGTSSITSITGTSVKVLTAYGITGYTYVTQRATNVNQMTWLNLATNTLVSPAVIISVTDSNPPSPSAFYRLLWSGY